MGTINHTVICGAGIAGIAAAHALAVTHGVANVMLVDEGSPMSLTSDKSSEAYRNWWPGPDDAMIRLMNRSIDLLEQWADNSNNRFSLNRRGYLYATADAEKAKQFLESARLAETQGAGALRVYRSVEEAAVYVPSAHRGYVAHPDGGDLFLDQHAIRKHFPFLAPDIVAVLHARRCGWLSGQQLGMFLLEEARASGVGFLSGRVNEVTVRDGHVSHVSVTGADGANVILPATCFINAAGPHAQAVSRLVGIDLPLFSELHLKLAFEDTLGVIDRNTGLVILDDAQQLDWTDDERLELASSDDTRWLTEALPAGIHFRPEGYGVSKSVLMLWDYHSGHRYDAPVFPLPDDPLYPEVVLRGMTRLSPGLSAYLDRLPHSVVDGGYYTKTEENRPLIGALPVGGAYVIAGLSGYGLMAAPAAADLLAIHITGQSLPSYAPSFALSRYNDSDYQQLLANWGSTGQL